MVLVQEQTNEAETSYPPRGAATGATPRKKTKHRLYLVIMRAYVYEMLRNQFAPWMQENSEDGSVTVIMRKLAENLSPRLHLPVPKLQRIEPHPAQMIAPQPAQVTAPQPAQVIEPQPAQMLRFSNSLPVEVFTNRLLVGTDNKPLQIELVNIDSGEICTEAHSSLKVEILVVRGGFPSNDQKLKACKALSPRNNATMPLLVQEATTNTARRGFSYKKKFIVKLHNGRAVVRGKITDNSSWVKSKKFKLIARVMKSNNQEKAIKVAVSEPFAVKESKLEGRKKHDTPDPNDPVYRLINVGRKYCDILKEMGINTVQEFLNKLESDPDGLKMGVGMQRMKWKSTVEHARKCQVPKEVMNNFTFEGNGMGDSASPNLNVQPGNIENDNSIHMITVEQMVPDSNLPSDQMEILPPDAAYNGSGDPIHFKDATSEVGECSIMYPNWGRVESHQWKDDFSYPG